jgi:hypothetical protein
MDPQHRSPPPAVSGRHHRAIQAADATYVRTLTLLVTARRAVVEARALRAGARNRRAAWQRAMARPCARAADASRPLVQILRTTSPDGNALAAPAPGSVRVLAGGCPAREDDAWTEGCVPHEMGTDHNQCGGYSHMADAATGPREHGTVARPASQPVALHNCDRAGVIASPELTTVVDVTPDPGSH